MSDLRGIKVGDKVWIVPRCRMDDSACYYAKVRKVGRKWVYAGSHKLELATGKSDWLEGSQVVAYRSREDWLPHKYTSVQWHALRGRFQRIGSATEPLKPEFVAAIQAVVDQYYPEEDRI